MTRHTVVPVRANGGAGSVRVLGVQSSADVTKRPDAVKASGAQSEGARMRGAFSAAQLCRQRPKNRTKDCDSDRDCDLRGVTIKAVDIDTDTDIVTDTVTVQRVF